MKRKSNRLRVRRLFVMGAGASFSASQPRTGPSDRQAPLDKDFTSRMCNLSVGKPGWVNDSVARIQREWKDQIPFTDFGLELAIIRQLGHLEFIDAIHPRRRRNAPSPYEWLNHVTHLIAYVLRRSHESSRESYRRFVDWIFPEVKDIALQRDRIVTFNYDDLLDRHIVARAGIEQTYFDRIKSGRYESDRRDRVHPHPLLVKLHGSVNWRCTEEEFRRIVDPQAAEISDDPFYLDTVWYAGTGTPSPDDPTQPLIVPPLPVKPITQISLFRFLWTKAYEYLHEAEHIIVCGYSLPDADKLAASLFGNFVNKDLRFVTVIDPDPAVLRKWKKLLRRPNVGRARWNYYEDFDEYVRDRAS